MLEFKKRVLEFKFDDKDCKLKYPTVLQVKEFSKKSVDGEDNLEVTLDFLVSLGLEKEIAECLEIDHLRQIIEHLTEQKKS